MVILNCGSTPKQLHNIRITTDWEGQWVHIAVTYTSADTSWQVYRNGTRIIHATQNYLGESSRLTIGSRYTNVSSQRCL